MIFLGVENDQFFITSDLITDLFRVVGSGISPWNSVADPLFNLVGQVPFILLFSNINIF